MLLDVLSDLLLLVFDIGGDVFFLRGVRWIDEVDATVLLGEEEGLVEVLLQSFEVDVQVLWHDHVLTVSYVRLAALILAHRALLRKMNLEVILHALHSKVGCTLLVVVVRDVRDKEAHLEVFVRNIAGIIFFAVVQELAQEVVNKDVGFACLRLWI